jgi:hypothetical protein
MEAWGMGKRVSYMMGNRGEAAAANPALAIVATIAMLAVLVGGIVVARPKGTSDMALNENTAQVAVGIPPIDAAAPTNLETATFGLG